MEYTVSWKTKLFTTIVSVLPIFIAIILITIGSFFVVSFLHRPKKVIPPYNPNIYKNLESQSSLVTSLFSMFRFSNLNASLGDEEPVPQSNLRYLPDAHMAKIQKTDGTLQIFFTALNKTYLLEGKTLSDAALVKDANNIPLAVLNPQGTDFDSSYSGVNSVIADNPTTLLGIYQGEKRVNADASGTQITTIGLARSTDEGKTWERRGKIITGIHELPLGTQTSGVGNPCAVVMDKYIYLYYVDWNDHLPATVHLARSPLASHGEPGSWEKYTINGFTVPGIGGVSDPIISPNSIGEDIVYVANPSISYNTYYHAYVGIFETNKGFYAALSLNGIRWRSFREIFSFPKDTTIPKKNGDVWYSYPTYLSDNTPTDMITNKSGYLYYSRGVFGQYHTMVRRKITFK